MTAPLSSCAPPVCLWAIHTMPLSPPRLAGAQLLQAGARNFRVPISERRSLANCRRRYAFRLCAASLSRMGGVKPRILFASLINRLREGQSIRPSRPIAAA